MFMSPYLAGLVTPEQSKRTVSDPSLSLSPISTGLPTESTMSDWADTPVLPETVPQKEVEEKEEEPNATHFEVVHLR